jgi:predicted metal-binding protein
MRVSTKKGNQIMTKTQRESSLDSLRNRALELGAVDAKIIPVGNIVIEDRVVLKCKLGCEKYGKTLACPPHAPTPKQFRKIVNEYRYAMFMKFKSKASGDKELIKYLATANDPACPPEMRKKVDAFWSTWKTDAKNLLQTVLTLEKAAAKEGFLLAAGFVSGSCNLCEKCNVENGICINPASRRFSEEGVGVNVKATAEKAGVKFTLPFDKNPETFALLLID